MMHTILVDAVFVAMVLCPCVIAMFSSVDNPNTGSESAALDDSPI